MAAGLRLGPGDPTLSPRDGAEFGAADFVAIGSPMNNFAVPSTSIGMWLTD
jgi:FMN-dependent NADH-azoreductase